MWMDLKLLGYRIYPRNTDSAAWTGGTSGRYFKVLFVKQSRSYFHLENKYSHLDHVKHIVLRQRCAINNTIVKCQVIIKS